MTLTNTTAALVAACALAALGACADPGARPPADDGAEAARRRGAPEVVATVPASDNWDNAQVRVAGSWVLWVVQSDHRANLWGYPIPNGGPDRGPARWLAAAAASLRDFDADARGVYWIDAERRAVMRAELDGSDARPLHTESGEGTPLVGLAVVHGDGASEFEGRVFFLRSFLRSGGLTGVEAGVANVWQVDALGRSTAAMYMDTPDWPLASPEPADHTMAHFAATPAGFFWTEATGQSWSPTAAAAAQGSTEPLYLFRAHPLAASGPSTVLAQGESINARFGLANVAADGAIAAWLGQPRDALTLYERAPGREVYTGDDAAVVRVAPIDGSRPATTLFDPRAYAAAHPEIGTYTDRDGERVTPIEPGLLALGGGAVCWTWKTNLLAEHFACARDPFDPASAVEVAVEPSGRPGGFATDGRFVYWLRAAPDHATPPQQQLVRAPIPG